MNGRELSKTSLGDCPRLDDDAKKPVDAQEYASWAAAVAGCFQPAVTVPPAFLGFEPPESPAPEGWRPSVGSLTPDMVSTIETKGSIAAGSKAPTGGNEPQQRIQLRVNTKECGEVALVVERAEAGLRVVISAVNANVLPALHREALVMKQALESSGQSVVSLKIVQMDQCGTDVAKNRLTPSEDRLRSGKASGSRSKLNAAKRIPRRLLIIG